MARCCSDQCHNQTPARLSMCSNKGASSTSGAFAATAWSNVRILLQSMILSIASRASASFYVVLSSVLSVLSVLSFVFSLSDSLVPSSFYSLVADSDTRSSILVANIFRSYPGVISPLRMIALVNDERRTAVSYEIIPRSRSFLPPRRGGRSCSLGFAFSKKIVPVLSLSPLFSSLSIETLPVLFPRVLSLSLSIYLNVCLYISLSPLNPVLRFRSRISFLLSLEIHAIRSTQTGPHRLTPAQI